MNNTDHAKLIAEARMMCGRIVGTPDWHTATRLVDALEAAEQEVDSNVALWAETDAGHIAERERLTEQLVAAQAVIERVRTSPRYSVNDPAMPWLAVDAEDLDALLSQSSTDALQARDAEKWDEGYLTNASVAHHTNWSDATRDEKSRNPYRKGQNQ